jgi:hypothetical protein
MNSAISSFHPIIEFLLFPCSFFFLPCAYIVSKKKKKTIYIQHTKNSNNKKRFWFLEISLCDVLNDNEDEVLIRGNHDLILL